MKENADRETITIIKTKSGKDALHKTDPDGENERIRFL